MGASRNPLVLSLFPGLDGLGLGFEQEGFCVVAGPDLKWGRRVQDFHPTRGRFDGIIGGPPCQPFSPLVHLVRHTHGEQAIAPNLIPEFERCVAEAEPIWFVMENHPRAPLPCVDGYIVRHVVLSPRWLGEVQKRERRFSFGTPNGVALDVSPDLALFEPARFEYAVTSQSRAVPVAIGGSGKVKRTALPDGARRGPHTGPRRSIADMLELQGFPHWTLDEAPFTTSGKRELLGNAVPVSVARAIARAVKRVIYNEDVA